MIGIIVLAIVIVLYFLGIVGIWSVAGALVLSIGSFGALVYDGSKDKLKRAAFIIISIVGIAMMVYDAISG